MSQKDARRDARSFYLFVQPKERNADPIMGNSCHPHQSIPPPRLDPSRQAIYGSSSFEAGIKRKNEKKANPEPGGQEMTERSQIQIVLFSPHGQRPAVLMRMAKRGVELCAVAPELYEDIKSALRCQEKSFPPYEARLSFEGLRLPFFFWFNVPFGLVQDAANDKHIKPPVTADPLDENRPVIVTSPPPRSKMAGSFASSELPRSLPSLPLFLPLAAGEMRIRAVIKEAEVAKERGQVAEEVKPQSTKSGGRFILGMKKARDHQGLFL